MLMYYIRIEWKKKRNSKEDELMRHDAQTLSLCVCLFVELFASAILWKLHF